MTAKATTPAMRLILAWLFMGKPSVLRTPG
jgi:hypothetical protein